MPLYECADVFNGKRVRQAQVNAPCPTQALAVFARTNDERLGVSIARRECVVGPAGCVPEDLYRVVYEHDQRGERLYRAERVMVTVAPVPAKLPAAPFVPDNYGAIPGPMAGDWYNH